MIGIYKITSPSNKVYIGQSVDIKRRFIEHKTNRNKKKTKLGNSFSKYGFENHIFEIVIECEIDELNNYERFYQDEFDCLNNGLNCVLTETNSKSGKLSLETKKKISEANKNPSLEKRLNMSNSQKGKTVPLEMRQKISNSHLGKKHTIETRLKISKNSTNISDETRRKYSESHKGNIHTLETKEKISLALKNRKRSLETIKKISESKGKKVFCKSTGVVFNSVKEAAIHYKCNISNLHLKLKGIRNNNTSLIFKN